MYRNLTKNETSAGFIIYFENEKNREFLLLLHREGHWAFPKGHIKKNENILDAAKRELKEETGIENPELLSGDIVAEDTYYMEKYKLTKTVYYFLACSTTKVVVIDGKEIMDYAWCNFEESIRKLTYTQSKEILKKVNIIINEKKNI
jgi:tRNA nucleotidyltransferase (CCA-adding enzyme)